MTSCLLGTWKASPPSKKQLLKSLPSSSLRTNTWKIWLQWTPKHHTAELARFKHVSLGKSPLQAKQELRPWSLEASLPWRLSYCEWPLATLEFPRGSEFPDWGPRLSWLPACTFLWLWVTDTFWPAGRDKAEAYLLIYAVISLFIPKLLSGSVPGTILEVLGWSGRHIQSLQSLPSWIGYSGELEEQPTNPVTCKKYYKKNESH